jgi:signal transduction histidine kinase
VGGRHAARDCGARQRRIRPDGARGRRRPDRHHRWRGRIWRAIGPLASIADATERLADGETGVRVQTAGPRPVRRLAASFNAMADRLDRSRSDRQALLADVTHELRTPLQVIGGSVEAMLDGVHPRDEAHTLPRSSTRPPS